MGNCVEDKVWAMTFSLCFNQAAHQKTQKCFLERKNSVEFEMRYLSYVTLSELENTRGP